MKKKTKVAILLFILSSGVIFLMYRPQSHSGDRKGDMWVLSSCHGFSEAQLIKRLGVPNSSTEFVLSQSIVLPERYIGIHNTYHPNEDSTEGVVIRELAWEGKDYTEVIFFHLVDDCWMAFESIGYVDGVNF